MTSIEKLMEEARKAIIQEQRDKKIRASGRSARSLQILYRGNLGSAEGATLFGSDYEAKIVGEDYFRYQQDGRGPGGFPSIEKMLAWIKIKRIIPRDKISLKSLAYLFARKIATVGTDIFTGKRPGLNIKDTIIKLVKKFGDEFAKEKRKQLIDRAKRGIE